MSHDIDTVRQWDARGFARSGREVARCLIRGQLQAAAGAIRQLAIGVQVRCRGRDPHENLEEIVRLEERADVRSTFFLLARQTHRWDGTHPAHYQRLLPAGCRMLASTAEVGVHASTAAVDAAGLQEEQERLATLCGARAWGVRFHNLRGGSDILPAVAAAGFDYDSTLGFAEEPGYRAGIARPFRVYDRERDQPLDLIEIPLALMDTTLLSPRYLGLKIASGRTRALAALAPLGRWGGAAAVLWHNDNLPPNEAGGYAALYTELIEWTRAAGGQLASLGQIAADWRRTRAALQGTRNEE